MSERAKVTTKTPEAKKESSVSQTKKNNLSKSASSPIDQILYLQRTVGNRAVERLLKSGVIQAKLTIGQPGDIYEQEADRVADDIMRMPDPGTTESRGGSEYNKDPSIQRVCTECEEELHAQIQNSELGRLELGHSTEEELHGQTDGIQIQRMCSGCEEELHRQPMEEEEEEESLQTKEVPGGTPEVTPDVEAQINSIRGRGQPLSESDQSFFEPRFGYDFSQVRVHTDSEANESAQSVNAKAYTVGRDVVFGAGQYAPETESGKKLIAHELTHVMQQHGSTSDIPLQEISTPADFIEHEAHVKARTVPEAGLVPTLLVHRVHIPPSLQRVCTPAATCAAPVVGSTEEYRATAAAEEVSPRERRRRMTPERAIASGHSGRARQLESFLEAQIPGQLANVQGIFIDWDMSSGAFVQDCASWISSTLPPGTPTPPGMAGATKDCMFVPGPLNPQALAFNTTTSARIGGMPREQWRVETLQVLTHEVEHVIFDTAAHTTPPGITTATCTRPNIGSDLSEIAAFLSEFPIVFRAIPAGAAATHPMRRRMADWFQFVINDAGNNIEGMLESMGCQCECSEVDAFVTDTFHFVSASWTTAEKNAFHTELRKPVWGLRWPLAPTP